MLTAILFSVLSAFGWVLLIESYPTLVVATRMQRRLSPTVFADNRTLRFPIQLQNFGGLRKRQKQLGIDFLDRIVRLLRSGNSLTLAVQQSAESLAQTQLHRSRDFADLARRIQRGLPLKTALRDFHTKTENEVHRRAGRAIEMAVACGGATSRVLDDVAESLRNQLAVEQEAIALSAQAKISAIVLGLSPLGFSAFISLLHPSFLHVLFGTTIGWFCLFGGCLLDILGVLWMRQLLRRAV